MSGRLCGSVVHRVGNLQGHFVRAIIFTLQQTRLALTNRKVTILRWTLALILPRQPPLSKALRRSGKHFGGQVLDPSPTEPVWPLGEGDSSRASICYWKIVRRALRIGGREKGDRSWKMAAFRP